MISHIRKVYLLILVLGCFAQADQVNCIKWKDANGTVIGTYCRPFTVVAGNGIALSDNHAGAITISTDGVPVAAGAGGSDTQINYNSSGTLAGSSGLTWNNSTSTLNATNITGNISGVNNKPFIDMVRDCGLVADGVTDDSASANACFVAYPGYGFYFPKTAANFGCSYWFASQLVPKGDGTALFGASSGFRNFATNNGGTALCFAAGVSGILLDLLNTTGASIHDLDLQGQEGTSFQTDFTLANLPAGSALPQFDRNIATIQRASNVLTVTITAAGGQEGLSQLVGSTVKIAGVVGDTTMNGLCVISTLTNLNAFGENATGFTCAQNGSDAGAFGAVGKVGLPTTGASTADGIRVCGNFFTISHVSVKAFGRHGINADAVAGHGCNFPFSDDLTVRDSVLANNQGDGVYCQGTDCNVNLYEGNNIYYNVLWGAEDNSALGNTWIGNNFSNNGAAWVGTGGTPPPTKAISSISRTLSGGDSTVTVVLSVADTKLKQGSCVVIAGVTDSSFNTAAAQCFFITSFTNSTHFQYIQPGAPANASSSGGTSRMAKLGEVYLSAGVDSGAAKMATQSPSSGPTAVNMYVEGGQECKINTYVIQFGFNCNSTSAPSTWRGSFLSTQNNGGFGGLAGNLASNIKLLTDPRDLNYSLNFRAGIPSTARDVVFNFLKYDNSVAWVQDVSTAGTAGDTGAWIVTRNSVRRFALFGINNSSGITRLNSESTGAVQINNDANSGTGGLLIASGGASPSTVATIDSAGKGTFTALADTTYADITEIAAPSNPSAGVNRLYADSTAHTLKCLTSSGASCFVAATATALAADGANCSGNNFALGVDASGAGQCAQPAFSNLSGTATDAQVPDNITISLAATATALAADPANCSAGSVAAGITAAGVAEGCAVFAVTKAAVANQFLTSYTSGTGAFTSAQPAFTDISGAATDAQVPDNITVTLAATATALAANPADCTSGQFANAINASGTLACTTVWTVSGTSTFTTSAVASGACQTTVTTAATGTATTDTIDWAYSTAPVAATDGRLNILPYVTANNVNFMRCNPTAASVTPTALTVNWRVIH